jgi:hypothetical protein
MRMGDTSYLHELRDSFPTRGKVRMGVGCALRRTFRQPVFVRVREKLESISDVKLVIY